MFKFKKKALKVTIIDEEPSVKINTQAISPIVIHELIEKQIKNVTAAICTVYVTKHLCIVMSNVGRDISWYVVNAKFRPAINKKLG